MQLKNNFLYPFIILFSLLTGLFLTTNKFLLSKNVDFKILIWANIIFFIIYLLVFLYQKKALQHSNPNVFIRSIMGGMMAKMFLTVIAVFGYVVLVGDTYNKKAVFISLIIYLLYLSVEVYSLMKLVKTKNG
jgi:hypothetical protein